MRGRRNISFMIGILFAIVFILSACSGSESAAPVPGEDKPEVQGGKKTAAQAEQAEVIELVVNNSNPSTHHWAYNVYEPWKEIVEEKTEGRVKVTIYHGAILGSSSTALEDLKAGLYDVSLLAVSPFYDTELFPLTIGNLPFAFPSPQSTADVMDKYRKKYGDFREMVYLGSASTDVYHLLSKEPIKTVEDLQGKKIRVAGKGEVSLAKAWGAAPVTVKTEELYQALQKGTIDAAIYSSVGGYSVKLQEVSPNMTIIPISTTPAFPMMSKIFYDKLPDDLKALFENDLGPKLAELFVDSYTDEAEASYEGFAEETAGKGGIYTPPAEEVDKFKGFAKARWEEWVQDAKDKGYDGEQMMNDFKALLEEEGLPLPF